MLDYRDRLALDEETASALRGSPRSTSLPAGIATRECAILNVMAAYLAGAPGRGWPSSFDVQAGGLSLRREMLSAAHRAEDALRKVRHPTASAEDVLDLCYDLTHWDRAKDYLMYAVLPPSLLRSKTLGVITTSSQGPPEADLIIGTEFDGAEENTLWVLVHENHMRMLVPPAGKARQQLLGAGLVVRELPAWGWEAILGAESTGRRPSAGVEDRKFAQKASPGAGKAGGGGEGTQPGGGAGDGHRCPDCEGWGCEVCCGCDRCGGYIDGQRAIVPLNPGLVHSSAGIAAE